jgi:hypothetical protein
MQGVQNRSCSSHSKKAEPPATYPHAHVVRHRSPFETDTSRGAEAKGVGCLAVKIIGSLFVTSTLAFVPVLLTSCEVWECNASTCPTGCCSTDGTCLLNGGASACGVSGSACRTCDGLCTNGQCVCNEGLEPSTVRTSWGIEESCKCTPRSCPNGCCKTTYDPTAGTQVSCVPFAKQSSTTCGNGGTSCSVCSGQTCTQGRCCLGVGDRCGTSAGATPCCPSTQCQSSFGSLECRP